MLTKEKFIEAIEALKEQYDFDASYTKIIEEAFRVDSSSPYDNSNLVNFIMRLLQEKFPAIDGDCAIEHYCYESNFGRVNGNTITAEQLWDQLNAKKADVGNNIRFCIDLNENNQNI